LQGLLGAWPGNHGIAPALWNEPNIGRAVIMSNGLLTWSSKARNMTTLSFMVVPQTCGSKNPGASSDDIWRNT